MIVVARSDTPQMNSKHFLFLMKAIVASSLLFAVPEVAFGSLFHNIFLLRLGILTAALSVVGSVSWVAARKIGFERGVLIWCFFSILLLAFIPLVATGLLVIPVGCSIIDLLLVAIFISPRHIKRFIVLYGVILGIATLLEYFVPWPRLTMVGNAIIILLGVNVSIVVVIGGFIILLSDIFQKALDTSRAYANLIDRTSAEELRHMATHDILTHLPNRVLLVDRFQQVSARARRYHTAFALLMIDLDHFKEINDSLGHGAGDQLLVQTAERLQKSLRESDTVARMGGDEFIALLGDLQDPSNAALVADRILRALERPFQIEGREVHAGASIGISSFPADGDNLEEIMKNADMALYAAKEQGRHTHVAFTSSMSSQTAERAAISSGLVSSVANGELMLLYQPIVDIETGLVVSLEALMRWNHPTMGVLSPLQFIPVAEETGLIVSMGAWVFENVCRQIAVWRDSGHTKLKVAVNFSARQIHDAGLLEMVRRIVKETGIDPHNLEIEITESSAMKNVDMTKAVLTELRSMGMSITIDDFGSGYSSLHRLKSLPVDAIKIDRFFVQNIVDDPDNTAIVSAIIALARSLNLKVIAEGVETKTQLEYLRSLKFQFSSNLPCDQAQGFLFSQPLPVESINPLLGRSIETARVRP